MNLTDFLLTRIAEDEEKAKAARGALFAMVRNPGEQCRVEEANDFVCHFRPGRMVIECEMKRRIVTLYESALQHGSDSAVSWLHAAIGALALPYADHPDYDEAWRP